MTNDKLDKGFQLDSEIQFIGDLLLPHKWDPICLRETLKEVLTWRPTRLREHSALSEEQLLKIAGMFKSALEERLALALNEFQQL